MKRRAGAAILEHHNQYPPMHGIPELRQVTHQSSGVECIHQNEDLCKP